MKQKQKLTLAGIVNNDIILARFNVSERNFRLGRVGKPRQRALTAILPPELRQKKLDVA